MTSAAAAPTNGPKFGVWALVPGSWASFHHPEDPVDASWGRVKRQILAAEAQGYDATLIAQHTINPSGADIPYLEAWSALTALAALTSRIELIGAIKPFLLNPVVFAKQALGIDEISGGRLALNIVNGWFRPEAERSGLPFLEHDERYAYGREWLTIVRGLIAGEEVSFSGRYFNVQGVKLSPGPVTGARPRLYVGGESGPARDLAADLADVFFLNGQALEDAKSFIADVKARRKAAPPLRFAISAFVISRDTEAEAQAELARAWEIGKADAEGFASLYANADTKATMFESFRRTPHIGTNGGTAAGLVGSHDQVAERIAAFHAAGVDLFMLQFQPFERGQQHFAEQIIPRVRALTGNRVAVPA